MVVHQIGKVGSTTVVRALRDAGIASYHVHSLRPDRLRDYAHQRRSRETAVHRHDGAWVWEGELLSKRLPRRGRPWNVITLVRDPVARDVSDFFQDLHLTVPAAVIDAASESDGELAALFDHWNDRWVTPGVALDAPTWFEEEFHEVLGIDLLDHPFSVERGWEIYAEPHVRILVMRTEDLTTNGSEALRAFLGIEASLPKANTRADSSSSLLYKRFLANLELPRDYLDRSYGSAYARHFYSDAQLAVFRSRWQEK